MINIAIIAETKQPADSRTPLSPGGISGLKANAENLKFSVQPSSFRCFNEAEFKEKGALIETSIEDSDILMGVKEVNIDCLIEGKTYMFFSHTAKKQSYNRNLLQACLTKKIRLIDYEYLENENGRVVAFGRWAGIVGAYNTLRAIFLRFATNELMPAHSFKNYAELKNNMLSLMLPPLKIAVTGTGRVSSGVSELLDTAGIKKVSPQEFLNTNFDTAVYSVISPLEYLKHPSGKEFGLRDVFLNPEEFTGNFKPYTRVADVYISAHFWHPDSPVFFDLKDISDPEFNIKIVGDISCDIGMPIPTTVRSSTIEKPFFGIDKSTHLEIEDSFSENAITVMAVDNLPNELPRDASESFSQALVENVFPNLIESGFQSELLRNATICENGKLTPRFAYLKNFAEGKE